MGKIIKTISDLLFISGLAVAGLFLLGHFTGRKPFQAYIVSSGSMEPAIHTGSVVVVSPKSSYAITDVVTFYTNQKKSTTTHRIVASDGQLFKVAGDANNQPDPVLVDKSEIIGSVRLAVPFVGYLAAQAKTPRGFILLVIVPATIIIYEELRSLIFELKKLIKRRTKNGEQMEASRAEPCLPAGRRTPLAGVEHVADEMPNPRSHFLFKPAIILPIFFALLIPLTLTISYFIDRETSAGNSFTGTIPTPSLLRSSSAGEPTPTPEITPTETPVPTETPLPTEIPAP